MSLSQSYRLRLQRKRWRVRALRKRRELKTVADRTERIIGGDVLCLVTMRNEMVRLPYFLSYYRNLGIGHFLVVDNGSDDGSGDYMASQPDVSLWRTNASYKRARFGMDWINGLARRYAHGHWMLTVDPDEFFIFPFCDTRPIRALTDWLDTAQIQSFGAMLLDMYPKGEVCGRSYRAGQDPFEIASWFDAGNYTIEKNHYFGNLWIQGGPRARMFFADDPAAAPALNKIPLVRWDRGFTYASSTHMLLPKWLNQVYDEWGGEKVCGCLLHAKFLETFESKTSEEIRRSQHYASGREYRAYDRVRDERSELWGRWSEKYINWRQLEILGLMSKGNWA